MALEFSPHRDSSNIYIAVLDFGYLTIQDEASSGSNGDLLNAVKLLQRFRR